ncbi:MAG: hypothetical protein EHM80_13145 [Nitrospiraceae bacterium]|nr:MAG: hypothetical protein EHM80_13145 [Nitrospiraceae bacterium]
MIMHLSITVLLATSLVALAGCASYVKQSDVCVKGYYGYVPQGECPAPISSRAMIPDTSKDAEARTTALEKENQRLTAELNAIQHRTAP